MPTYKNTWDSEHVSSFLDLASKRKNMLFQLFWGNLEHDSETAKELAASENAKKHEPELREKLKAFKAAYLDLRKVLLKATKDSEKF
jgi:hypothetical protein